VRTTWCRRWQPGRLDQKQERSAHIVHVSGKIGLSEFLHLAPKRTFQQPCLEWCIH
jgi:hypothetical protein